MSPSAVTGPASPSARVAATQAALDLIAALIADYGPILFHQSGGCCDGSSPMCYPLGEFMVGDRDVKLGEIGGAPVYIGAAQYELWRHTQLIIDVTPGRGGMFSLDNGREVRFLTRGRVFSEAELTALSQGEAGAGDPSPPAQGSSARSTTRA